MDRWKNKVAVVTGASSGIGAACVVGLVKAGMVVVALARREDKLISLKQSVPQNLQSKMYPMKCDVTVEGDVVKIFNWIKDNLSPIHVLVNNAGILKKSYLSGTKDASALRDTVETNIMAVTYCVREAYQQMKAHKIDGHIVIVNSIVGHFVPVVPCSSLNIYPATKHAVTAMTEIYRQEFSNDGTNVKVTSISPGVVDTEIVPEEFRESDEIPLLKSEDISNAILYCISTPKHVQIHELTIKPMHEKF